MSDYDTDQDGRISKAEFRAKMPKSVYNKGVDEVFDKQDLNGTYTISIILTNALI